MFVHKSHGMWSVFIFTTSIFILWDIELGLHSISAWLSLNSALNTFNRSDIWQARRQRCCRTACRISKGIWIFDIHSNGLETLRNVKKAIVQRYLKNKAIEKSFRYVNLKINYLLKLDFQKVDQHTGGKWSIHDTKQCKDNQLQCLKLPCKIA